MFKLFNPQQSDSNGQDGDNPSLTGQFNQAGDQSSFNSFDQIGVDPLYSVPMAYGVAAGALAPFGWGFGPASSPGLASAASASRSVSAASVSPPSIGLTLTSAGSGASAAGSGGAASNAASKSSFSGSSQIVSNGSSAIVFDNTYTANCTQSYMNCIVAAESQIESLFTTFNAKQDTIVVTFDEQNSGNNGVALGNSSFGHLYSYGTLASALQTAAPNDVLPSDPSGGSSSWYVPNSYERMLGLNTTTGSPDLSVTLNSYYNWSFGQDVINGVTHELSEGGMGRIGGLGGAASPFDNTGYWGTMDLFRYSAPGVTDYNNGRDGTTTYFSPTGSTLSNQALPAKGAPTLSYNNQYNSNGTVNNTGDTADWTQQSVFGSTGTGETLTLTQTELGVLQALGWTLTLTQDVVATSGTWETPADWSAGSMPIEAQDAYINGADVTLNSNVIVNSIATSSGAILSIGDAAATTLTAVRGTDLNTADSSSVASGNLGEIIVYTGSALQVGYFSDTFDNGGTLFLGKGAGGSGVGDLNIAGTITLNGGGTVTLGQSGTGGDILNASDGNGGVVNGSLVNVDNTIQTQSGSTGLINLGLGFDNQAGGKVVSASFLQIIAPTLTNEGAMTADAGATLNLNADGGASGSFANSGTMTADAGGTLGLGSDGVTETLTNTGSILVGQGAVSGSADLAIGGNLTVAGSGAIWFKGAGASITSDGSPATFTNASTIDGIASGQIGDGNLTFDNSGTAGASGSGVTLTINTGGNTVLNASGGVLQAENSATLAIVSNVTNQGVIDVGATNSSSTGTVDLGQDGGTGSMTNTGAIAIYAGSDLAISGAYTITGSGTLYYKGAGADITSDGKAAATFTNASTIEALASGQIGDQGILASNDLTFDNSGTAGASGSGVALTINTGGNTILNTGTLVAANGATLAIISNANNQGTISAGTSSSSSNGASTGTVDLGLDGGAGSMNNTGFVDIWGGSDLAIGGNYTIAGSGDVAIKGAGGSITSDGTAATFTNASTIEVLASGQIGDAHLTFVNAGSVIIASGDTLTLTGSSTLTGSISGAGGLTLGGAVAINGGANLTEAKLTLAGVGTAVTLNENLSYGGAFWQGGNPTLSISSGDTLTLTGSSTLTGSISGAGGLTLGGAVAINGGAKLTEAKLTLAGVGTAVTLNENLSYGGTFLQGANPTLSISSGDTLTLTGSSTLTGSISGAGGLTLSGGSTTIAAGAALTQAQWTLTGAGTAVSVKGSLSYAGSFSDASGATLSILSGAKLSLSGTATLSAKVTGAGSLAITGGTTSIVPSAAVSVTNLSVTGAATTLAIGEAFTFAHVFSANGGATVNLSGGNFVLTGANSFSSATVTGAHTLFDMAASSASGLKIGGTTTFENTSTLTQSGGTVTVGDSAGNVATLFNAKTGIYDITDNSGIARGTSTASLFANNGLFEKTGGTGTSAVLPRFTSAGTVTAATGTIAFSGATNNFSGTIGGSGAVSFTGGVSTINAGTTVSVASLTATGASTTLYIAGNLSYAGSFSDASGATLSILSGAKLSLSGTATLSAKVTGAGSLAITGGTTSIVPSATVSVTNLSVTGAATTLAIGEAFTFAHVFSANGGATVNLSGGNFVLTGANSFSSATVTGAHTLFDMAASSASGLKIGGTTTFENTSTLTQSGGTVTVGDSAGNVATLFNAATGIYDITDNSGIARGTSTASLFANNGLFEKTGGTGTSVIAPRFYNGHAVSVSSGTLDFTGAVTGTGTDTISGGATLEFNATVGAGQTIAFSGSNNVLDLTAPTGFGGSVSGFIKTDMIDFAGAWSLLSVTENAAQTQATLTLSSGSLTDHLLLNGVYAKSDFTLTAGAGNTTIIAHV